MKVSILGTGSFGSALANILANNGHTVVLWGILQEEIDEINNYHTNSKYFEDVKIHESVKASTNLEIIKDSDMILFAIPSIAINEVSTKIIPYLTKPFIAINVAKGFHPVTHERLSIVIKNAINSDYLIDVVSLIGPSHAEEVVLGLLTTVNAVCENDEVAKKVQLAFSNDFFRVYRNNDVIGAEIGVALKNIMAIASGILVGVGQGDNAKAALMARGLNEMVAYGTYFNGLKETYLGLTGVGDLIVTCTSHHSRNFQAGLAIGKAGGAKEFLKDNKKTVEGIVCCKIVHEVAKENGISMPITEQVYQVLFEDKNPIDSINELMNRDLKKEN